MMICEHSFRLLRVTCPEVASFSRVLASASLSLLAHQKIALCLMIPHIFRWHRASLCGNKLPLQNSSLFLTLVHGSTVRLTTL